MPRRRLKSRPPLAASALGATLALAAAPVVTPVAPAASGATPASEAPAHHVRHQLGRAPDPHRVRRSLREVGHAPRRKAARPADLTFKVGTLNILGSQHTRGGDRRRTARTAELIRRHHLGVVLMQEVQEDQYHWLDQELPGYRIWPGDSLGPQGIRLQIAWKRNRFELMDHGTITTTFSHQRIPTPWVELRDDETGHHLFVVDVHNSPVNQEHDRDTATRKELGLYQELRDRGPVFIGGDTNEHDEWFCKVTGRTDALAANGGSHDGRCQPPRPVYIDWLMGRGHYTWRHYQAQETDVSDHMLHTATLRWDSPRQRAS